MSDEIKEVRKFFEHSSCAIHANALSALFLRVLAWLFDILSQVRERLRLMYENYSLEKFSPAFLSFQLQFWKIFLQPHAVLQQSLGFKCSLFFSLCFLLKNNELYIMKYCLIRKYSYTFFTRKGRSKTKDLSLEETKLTTET